MQDAEETNTESTSTEVEKTDAEIQAPAADESSAEAQDNGAPPADDSGGDSEDQATDPVVIEAVEGESSNTRRLRFAVTAFAAKFAGKAAPQKLAEANSLVLKHLKTYNGTDLIPTAVQDAVNLINKAVK